MLRLRLTKREALLIQELTASPSDVADVLEKTNPKEGRFEIPCSLDDLDELLGAVAAEANHAKIRKKSKELDALYDKLQRIQDEEDGDALPIV